jgi:hypothetical protein
MALVSKIFFTARPAEAGLEPQRTLRKNIFFFSAERKEKKKTQSLRNVF